MKFGTQCGPGAQSQLNAAIASKLIGRIRFPVRYDSIQPIVYGPSFVGSVDWCKINGTIPHIIIGEQASPQNWWDWYQSFIRPLFDWLWSKGITEASFEVQNEPDTGNPLNTTATSAQDVLMRDYKRLFQQCSAALVDFLSTHPAKYTIGGSASATGMAFTSRLLTWCRANNVKMDFASCHYYGLGTPISIMRDEIRMIKGICDIPVWITELGYDANNAANNTSAATNWIKEFMNGPLPDEIIWEIHESDNGSGLWKPDGTVSKMGQVMLAWRRAVI